MPKFSGLSQITSYYKEVLYILCLRPARTMLNAIYLDPIRHGVKSKIPGIKFGVGLIRPVYFFVVCGPRKK